ncbi:MAG TPA: CoA pyrophosphatase [Chloroflexota bacterium]|jgi:8-oxo-dGTP pyrophosphatase MutT (NUDIX family)|nr:CoA pyrophosphatase [Chloroflexota bacterium]
MTLTPPLDLLKERLQSRPLNPVALASPTQLAPWRPGAILILTYPLEGVPYLVLTLRPNSMRRHAGQICLPGGGYEPGDGSLLATALRETEEELGVPPHAIEIWGALDQSVITVSRYQITPFVGFARERPSFKPNPDEVAEIVEVPVSLLTDSTALREEIRELSTGPRAISFYPWREHKIWGATARVLGQLAFLLDESAKQPIEI